MIMKTKSVKELQYYLKTRQIAIRRMTSEPWDSLYVINLRLAFKKGYEAKNYFQKKG